MANWSVKRNADDDFDVLEDGVRVASYATAVQAGRALRGLREEAAYADYMAELAADEIRAESAWLRAAEYDPEAQEDLYRN